MRVIWPWQSRDRQFSWLKASALALVLLPAIRFAYQVHTGEFGIFPMALSGMVFWSGVWATVILLLALGVTPAAKILRSSALIDIRRTIGVTALIYTLVHAMIFFALRSWDLSVIVKETIARWSPIVALLSTVGLIVLAATSFDAAVQTMGHKRWQWLHNTIHVTAPLAVSHVLLVRGVYPEQFVLTGIFFWLVVWRVLNRYGMGTNLTALVLLAFTSSVITALLEALWFWSRRGYSFASTLGNNFSFDALEIGVPPAWQVLAFGLVFVLGGVIGRSFQGGRGYSAAPAKA
jgi:sulfoxide reductase heme-binding subunit YedZ